MQEMPQIEQLSETKFVLTNGKIVDLFIEVPWWMKVIIIAEIIMMIVLLFS